MTDYTSWHWMLMIGLPVIAIVIVLLRRQVYRSLLWRLVLCFLAACIITPISFNNGHSAAWVLPASYLLAGFFSGRREEFLIASRVLGLLIVPATLLLFGLSSAIIIVVRRMSRPA